jgi:hypothetical protein
MAVGCGASDAEEESIAATVQEGFPAAVVEALQRRDAELAGTAVPQSDTAALRRLHSVILLSKRWSPGQTVTVAFLGGDTVLHRKIQRVVERWSTVANLTFDFGDTDSGAFRGWSRNDTGYGAHVRIAFDEVGYWSHVGTDAIDPDVAPASHPSMNVQGFDQSLPDGWEATVLHEFGHAMAFEHEHQSPEGTCELEFRWENDAGYEPTPPGGEGGYQRDASGRHPGIYTVLGGPPNEWEPSVVDYNLRKLRNTREIRASRFDRASIMKYYFEPWMLVSGTRSSCYSRRSSGLSDGDRRAAAEEYPRDPAIAQANEAQIRKRIDATLDSLRLPGIVRRRLESGLDSARASQEVTNQEILKR